MPNDGGQSLPPVEALRTILGTLAPGEWADLEQLAAVYDVFCFGVQCAGFARNLRIGLETGQPGAAYCGPSALLSPAGDVHTRSEPRCAGRIPASPSPTRRGPGGFAHIPFADLEILNLLAHLEVEQNQLVATPSRVKLGRVSPQIRESALGVWLSSQIPAFGETFRQIAENWGKTILHTHLLIAQVRDLSLRVQLERALEKIWCCSRMNLWPFRKRPAPRLKKLCRREGSSSRR